MEPQALDIIYYTFIALVVIGGIVCIVIMLPKEHKMWDDTEDCYRICQKNGNFMITKGKANFFENRKDYIYLKRSPFLVEGFTNGVKNESGCFKATAEAMVQFPPALIAVSAPVFGGSNHESVVETINEVLTASLNEAIESGCTEENDAFKEKTAEILKEKLRLFGVELLSMTDVRLSADTSVE